MYKWFIVIMASLIFSSSLLAADKKLSSGMFFIKNNTNKTVKVGVGNFFPSSYTISPHSSSFVIVSSDNQNIQIDSISE